MKRLYPNENIERKV